MESQEHTECLVNFANSSKPLRDSPGDLSLSGSSFPSVPVAKNWTQERFEQRLGEYTSFWTSLERLCRWGQHQHDHGTMDIELSSSIHQQDEVILRGFSE